MISLLPLFSLLLLSLPVRCDYLLQQKGQFSLVSAKYATFRKRFIDNYDSFFDSGEYRSSYSFKSLSNPFQVSFLNTTSDYYCFSKYYVSRKDSLCYGQIRNSSYSTKDYSIANHHGLFRNRQEDIQKIVLSQDYNEKDDLTVQFSSSFQIREYSGYFNMTVFCSSLLVILILLCVWQHIAINIKISQVEQKLRKLKHVNDRVLKKGQSLEFIPVSSGSMLKTPSNTLSRVLIKTYQY